MREIKRSEMNNSLDKFMRHTISEVKTLPHIIFSGTTVEISYYFFG